MSIQRKQESSSLSEEKSSEINVLIPRKYVNIKLYYQYHQGDLLRDLEIDLRRGDGERRLGEGDLRVGGDLL